MRIEAQPAAKINLTLAVFGGRPDGFHELVSIFLRIGLSDRLTMEPGTGSGDRLTVTGLPGTPTDDNLVLKALEAVRRLASEELPPLDVFLDKRIPAAAGLGGGSSDAASALQLAQAAWGIRIPPGEESDLAASLGSDVPFFCSDAAAALVSGRGERLSPLPSGHIHATAVLLVTPPFRLSTAEVFQRHDHLALEVTTSSLMNEEISGLMYTQPTAADLIALTPQLRDANDLWQAAASLEPALPVLRQALERETRVPWLMSGSGPTLFAIYASVDEASAAGQSLAESRLPELESALINAVDLVGPDPKWRYP